MRLRPLFLALLLAAPADAAIIRFTWNPFDLSGDTSARTNQLVVADTAAECPSSDVGDGDLCYAKDTDVMRARANGAWVNLVTGVQLGSPGADDQAFISDSTSAGTWRSIPDCEAENMLTYDTATNTFGCEADAGGGGGGDNLRVEDSDNAGTFTAATDPDFDDGGDINWVLDTGATPDTIQGTVRADSVALTTDTTGNYAAGDGEAGAALTGDTATAFFSAGTLEDARVDGSLEADEVNPTLGTQTQGNYVAEVTASLGLAESGSPGETAAANLAFDYAQTLAGNPALNADECIPVATASGGGLLCEGGTANTNEMLFLIPDLDEADTTHRWVTDIAAQTLTNKTLAAADNVIEADTGDSATSFFSAGTIEDARIDGSAEADEISLANLSSKDIDQLTGQNDIDTEFVIDGVEFDFDAGTANAWPRLLNESSPTAGDCDAAGEAGRLLFDGDDDTDGTVKVCTGAGGWKDVDDDGAGGGGDSIRVEDSDNGGAFTAATDPDFDDGGDINWVLDTGATPDTITGLVRPDSVALTTDTTGNYAAGDGEAGAALTGDSATDFFSAGTVNDARIDGSAEADEVNPTLGTQTQGNYLADCTNGLGITGCPAAGETASVTPAFKTDDTLAGNPALGTEECVFTKDGSGSGGFLCEGTTADTQEQLYLFPSGNGNDTTSELTALGQTIEDAELASNYSGTGTCTNQFARVLNDNAAPTCATVTRSDVSTSLITDQYAFTLYDPNGLADTDDIPSIVPNRARAVTITEVWCESNDGTAVINLQRDDGSPANILSSNCTCGTGGTACTVDAAEDNLADGNNVDFVFVSETAVTRVNLQITYTVD